MFLPRVRIEKWRDSVICNEILEGFAYGHPRFPDGTYIYTSKVLYKNEFQKLVVTRNTIYDLGEKYVRT